MSEKYAIYLGDRINNISLWVREDGKEYPIFANTRGQGEWYSLNPDVYENTEPHSLSAEMKEWLAHIHRVENGLIEHDGMFAAKAIEADAPDADPEWYETEIVNQIGEPGFTPEQEDLLEWAYKEVEE